jgi:hypothetical protein
MIQAETLSDFIAYLSTEDNRIDTSVAKTNIRFLVKLTNDMDGSIDYVYPREIINNRFTKMYFTYESVLANVDIFLGEVHLLPAGYWKYEVYEVSWIGTVSLTDGAAPITSADVLLPVDDNKGVVQGMVTKGKLYLGEKKGTAEVQYYPHEEEEGTNYIYTGN